MICKKLHAKKYKMPLSNGNSLLWEKSATLSSLNDIAVDIANELTKKYFCLWLTAPVGGGKTTVVRQILYSIGLNKKIPVTSPTYSYLNEYEIETKIFAHVDCYRGNKFVMDVDSMLSDTDFYGAFIEWPILKTEYSLSTATHLLKISIDNSKLESRRYSFYILD